MNNNNDMDLRFANAEGKHERLCKMLGRAMNTERRKAEDFLLSYGVSIQDVDKESVRQNDKMFWDYCSWENETKRIADIGEQIEDMNSQIRKLREEDISLRKTDENDDENEDDWDMEM